MNTLKLASCLVAAAFVVAAQSASSAGLPDVPNAHFGKQLENSSDLTKALSGGSADLQVRLRYEHVEDDGVPAAVAGTETADLLSLRTALGYSTGRFHGLYARLGFEANTPISSDNACNVDGDFSFATGALNGCRIAEDASVIPDNEFREINEGYLAYRGADAESFLGQTTVKLGRQTIIYDNHRWVGNVVWRQNNVSMDAFRIDNTSIPKLSLSYAYVDEVNRLFGEDSVFDEWEMEQGHLINVSYELPIGKLTGYGYLLDFDDNSETPFVEGTGAAAPPAAPILGRTIFDSNTLGLRFVGKRKFTDAFTFLYELEVANQDPAHDALAALDDNNYYNIEAGGAFKVAGKPVVVKVGHEVLEGNGVNAVQTPLATVHAFNGWADKFVLGPGGSFTPPGGLKDTSVTLAVKGLIGPSKLVVAYHDFEADEVASAGPFAGNDDYGSEWNVLFAKPFGKNWLGLIKYARYDNDELGGPLGFDTQKFWVMGQYQFK